MLGKMVILGFMLIAPLAASAQSIFSILYHDSCPGALQILERASASEAAPMDTFLSVLITSYFSGAASALFPNSHLTEADTAALLSGWCNAHPTLTFDEIVRQIARDGQR